MKTIKALWKTLEVAFLSLTSGLTGAQIAIYLEKNGNYPLSLIVGTLIVWGVVLFIVYLRAPDEMVK